MSPEIRAIVFDYANVLFFPDIGLNRDLLFFIQNSIQPHFLLTILTASTSWQSEEIRPALLRVFAEIITTAELGFSKNQPEAFAALENRLGVSAKNMLLIDDRPENVSAMKQAGGQGIVYQSNAQLVKDLTPYVSR